VVIAKSQYGAGERIAVFGRGVEGDGGAGSGLDAQAGQERGTSFGVGEDVSLCKRVEALQTLYP